jgi:hypothetical protein
MRPEPDDTVVAHQAESRKVHGNVFTLELPALRWRRRANIKVTVRYVPSRSDGTD